MAKKLAKAQLGKIVKSLAKKYAGNAEKTAIKSVGKNTTFNYHPPQEWHGASGRKQAKQLAKDGKYNTALGLGAGAAAAGVGVLMAKKRGGIVKSKKK